MHTLTDLAEYCSLHPLEDKLLLGATLLQAQMWRDRLVREGSPWIALRVACVRSLAAQLLDAQLAADGIAFTADAPTLTESACNEGLHRSERYAAMRQHSGVHMAFTGAISDLGLAGLDVDALRPSDFETPDRHSDLASVNMALKTLLREYRCIDYPQLLRLTLEHLSGRPSVARPAILLPRDVYASLTPLERSVVCAAGKGEPILLGSEADTFTVADIHFRAAFTPAHEFRAALRDVFAAGTPFDEIEFVYTDRGRLPELYELCIETELPCTFAEGIPVQYSKTARTLQRFLEWLRDGDPYALIRLMYEGIPDFTAFSYNGAGANRLPAAAMLRDARIGRDVRGTMPRVDRHIALRQQRGATADDIDALCAARALIAAICDLIPQEHQGGTIRYHDLIRGTVRLVRELCRPASPGEPQAADSIADMLAVHALGPDIALPLHDAAARVLTALRNLRMPAVIKAIGATAEQASAPLPGHVFVTDLLHAGISGRSRMFLFGMDDESMPGERGENCVLFDAERRGIMRRTGAVLPLASDHARQRRLLLSAVLQRSSAIITVSFARYDESRLRTRGPSRELLVMFRTAGGNARATYRDLDSALSETAGDVPEGTAASPQEWWLRQLDAASASRVAGAMRGVYPMLRAGFEAELARASADFTIYDGATDQPAGVLPIQSASALEQLARCPYSYFLRYILRLYPPQRMRLEAGRWLSPAEHGSLVHSVLRSFMDAVLSQSLAVERWPERMETEIAAALATLADDNPPPGEAARLRTGRDLRDACGIFLRHEVGTTDSTFLGFETAFPSDNELKPPLKALEHPLSIETPNGEILLRGKIDRIEMAGDGTLIVTDYKTGKDAGKTRRPLAGGTRLQPTIYVEAVRNMAGDRHRSDIRFTYRYLSMREQGRAVTVVTSSEDASACIGLLLGLLRQGSFPHTSEARTCGTCEFSHVCGKAETTAARMNIKLDNALNTGLEPLRRLRDEY